MKYPVGSRVTWTSASDGAWSTKVGFVVEVVPLRRRPKKQVPGHKRTETRQHVSYIVRAATEPAGEPRLFWPQVSMLRPAETKRWTAGALIAELERLGLDRVVVLAAGGGVLSPLSEVKPVRYEPSSTESGLAFEDDDEEHGRPAVVLWAVR